MQQHLKAWLKQNSHIGRTYHGFFVDAFGTVIGLDFCSCQGLECSGSGSSHWVEVSSVGACVPHEEANGTWDCFNVEHCLGCCDCDLS